MVDNLSDVRFKLLATDVGGESAETERAKQSVDVLAQSKRGVAECPDHLGDGRSGHDGEVCHRNRRLRKRNHLAIQKGDRFSHWRFSGKFCEFINSPGLCATGQGQCRFRCLRKPKKH